MDVCSNSFFCSADKEDFKEWTKVEFDLQSSERNSNSRLQLTTRTSGIVWFDQVSLMPSDTYMVIYFPIIIWISSFSFCIITDGMFRLQSSLASTRIETQHSSKYIFDYATTIYVSIMISDIHFFYNSMNLSYLSMDSFDAVNTKFCCAIYNYLCFSYHVINKSKHLIT